MGIRKELGMNKLSLVVVILSILTMGQVSAKSMVRIKTIGKSPKGQFVAFEEFGFKNNEKVPYSRIRVMNMWKNRDVTKPINVTGSSKMKDLKAVRLKAKKLAKDQLKKFNINS